MPRSSAVSVLAHRVAPKRFFPSLRLHRLCETIPEAIAGGNPLAALVDSVQQKCDETVALSRLNDLFIMPIYVHPARPADATLYRTRHILGTTRQTGYGPGPRTDHLVGRIRSRAWLFVQLQLASGRGWSDFVPAPSLQLRRTSGHHGIRHGSSPSRTQWPPHQQHQLGEVQAFALRLANEIRALAH